MPYGYLGTKADQTAKNFGVFSANDVADLTKQGKFGGSYELIETQTYSSGVNVIDFTSIKQSRFDVHLLTINNLTTPVESGVHQIQFYESGVLETASVYQYAVQSGDDNGNFGNANSTGDSGIRLTSTGSGINQGAEVYFYNLGNSSTYSFATYHIVNLRSGNDEFTYGGGMLPQTSTVDGIRYNYTGSSTISNFTMKLYGVKQK